MKILQTKKEGLLQSFPLQQSQCLSHALKSLLLAEGHAVGALIHAGVGFVSTHKDPIQRAEVLSIAMMGALLDGAFNALVGVAIHRFVPPFSLMFSVFPFLHKSFVFYN